MNHNSNPMKAALALSSNSTQPQLKFNSTPTQLNLNSTSTKLRLSQPQPRSQPKSQINLRLTQRQLNMDVA